MSNGESETRKYHLVVKSQPQNEDARLFLKPSRTFEKEVQMYGQVRKKNINVRKKPELPYNFDPRHCNYLNSEV